MNLHQINFWLDAAKNHLDHTIHEQTPEVLVLDALYNALVLISADLEEMDRAVYRAANTASCLANGIIPD